MGRSILAVFLGLIAVFVLSLVTDQILHAMDVYPPWGEPMFDHGLCALALSYRLVYGVVGGYIAARLAPKNPMKHALILGGIGFVLSLAGAVQMADFGPLWYPVALVVTAIPCAWLGAKLVFIRHPEGVLRPKDLPS